MASINDLQSLANGMAFAGASSPGASQVIVTTPIDNSNGMCIPCEDAGCSVSQTQAVTMDLGQINARGGTKLRLDVVNGTSNPSNLTFLSNFGRDEATSFDYSSLDPIFYPNAFQDILFTVNGDGNAQPVSQINKVLAGGSVISKVTIQFDNTLPGNAGLQNLALTLFHIPVDPRNSLITDIVYDPFCDACFTTNNGNFTTHAYTINAPITFRDGLNILVPGVGELPTTFRLELCYGIIDIPNTQADTAGHQWA